MKFFVILKIIKYYNSIKFIIRNYLKIYLVTFNLYTRYLYNKIASLLYMWLASIFMY